MDGKAILVTGAASGIGAATVRALVASGAQVVAFDRDQHALEALVQDIDAPHLVTRCGDAGREPDVQDAVGECRQRFGRLDGAVGSAGIRGPGTAEAIALEVWHDVLRVNLTGPLLLARCAAPLLRESGGGSIVVVASQLGLVGARANVAYCAAKGGAINLVRALSLDLAADAIRVNVVCPGPTDTDMLRAGMTARKQQLADVIKAVPLGRVAQPHEVAALIRFLLSDDAAFITGTAQTVDGGYTAE